MPQNWVKILNYCKSLLIIAGFCSINDFYANHVLGGEITYVSKGGKSYEFQLKIFRNCGECEFNTSGCPEISKLDIFVSANTLSYAKKVGEVKLSKVYKKDITPTCYGVKSNCSSGGTYSNGIEEYLFTGTADFDNINKDYCEFDVAISIDYREKVYSLSNESYYNFCRINPCLNFANNSSQIQATPFQVLALNQTFTYNPLAIDTDGDSLTYELDTAYKKFGNSINYSSNNNPYKPISVKCPSSGICSWKPLNNPVEGIGINAQSGFMSCTPIVSGEMGFIVIKITEWRKISGKWENISIVRRDLLVKIVDIGNYLPKLSTPYKSYVACNKSPFYLDFSVYDQPYSGKSDTVSIQHIFPFTSDLKKIINSSYSNYDGLFKFNPDQNSSTNKTYYITIIAKDNACPANGSTYLTIPITIKQSPDPSFTIQPIGCNKFLAYPNNIENGILHNYSLFFKGNLISTAATDSFWFESNLEGEYVVNHEITGVNGCAASISDTIFAPKVLPFTAIINKPDSVCTNSTAKIKVHITGGESPFEFLWNGKAGKDSIIFKAYNDTTLRLKIMDKNACTIEKDVQVFIFEKPTIKISDTGFCFSNGSSVDLSKRISVKHNYKYAVNYKNHISFGLLNGSNFTPSYAGDNSFVITVSDINNCKYSSTLNISIVEPPSTQIIRNLGVCSNEPDFNLDVTTQNILKNGNWTVKNNAALIYNNKFIMALAGAGATYQANYTNNIKGCFITDSTKIFIKPAPIIKFSKNSPFYQCRSDASFSVSASPSGGLFEVNKIQLHLLSPAEFLNSNLNGFYAKYHYTDPIYACHALDSIQIFVNKPVIYNQLQPVSFCANEKGFIPVSFDNVQQLSYFGSASKFVQKEKINEGFIITSINKTKANNAFFGIFYKALPGCPSIYDSAQITIKQVPELIFLQKPNVGCVPFNTRFEIDEKSSMTLTDIHWTVNNTFAGNSNILNQNYTQSGIYNIKVTAKGNSCIADPISTSIGINNTPVISFTTNPATGLVSKDYPVVEFNANINCPDPYSINWNFQNAGPSFSNLSKVSVRFNDTGKHTATLRVQTIFGCAATEKQSISVVNGLQFLAPTAFSPNKLGPDENEKFRIYMDACESFELTIFSVTQVIVYKSNDQFKGWDGNFYGKPVPSGTYGWKVKARTHTGQIVEREGQVILIR